LVVLGGILLSDWENELRLADDQLVLERATGAHTVNSYIAPEPCWRTVAAETPALAGHGDAARRRLAAGEQSRLLEAHLLGLGGKVCLSDLPVLGRSREQLGVCLTFPSWGALVNSLGLASVLPMATE
jgi:hypothetical protein